MEPNGRLLIVDDDEGMRVTLEFALSSRGHHVTCASSGEAALEAVREESFDVALVDLSLPDVSGEQVIAELRTTCPDMALIVITGHASVDSAVGAVNEGVVAYLQKPFDVPDLMQRIGGQLEAQRLQVENRRMTARLVTVDRIGAVAGRSLDLKETMPECIAVLAQATGAEWGQVWATDAMGESSAVAAVGTTSVSDEVVEEGVRALLAQEAASNGRVHISQGNLSGLKLNGDQVLLIPLEAQGRPVGGAAFRWSDDRTIDPHDAGLLGAAVERLAAAVQNSRSCGELEASMVQLQRAQETLVRNEKLAAAGTLIAGVAHELNNPLTAIIGFTQYLASCQENETSVAVAERAAAQAKRCARIIENLLTFAREYDNERAPVDINQRIRDAVELQIYQLRLDNVEVELDLDPTLPVTEADPQRLHQVFVNLIGNAHHAMQEVGRGRALTISSRREQEDIVLEFADTGPGIPAEIRSRIFDPFFTTKALGQGTGLGLSLCYGIVTEHGGTIEALDPERGAVIRIQLPLVVPITQESEEVPRDDTAPEPARILVVDDEEVVVDLVQRTLGDLGHDVLSAADGLQAQRILAEEQVDVVISDVRMPVIDGAGLYAHLRSEHPDLLRRTVFITGDWLSQSTAEFLTNCGCRMLQKPFDVDKLGELVEDVLAEHRGHSTNG